MCKLGLLALNLKHLYVKEKKTPESLPIKAVRLSSSDSHR